MSMQLISDDAKAILLLCGVFGRQDPSEPSPLGAKEYNALAEWLDERDWRPADLLQRDLAKAGEAGVPPRADAERLRALLGRGAAMALAVEKWLNKGLWVACRSDADYPRRLSEHLKRSAPPILYGVGEPALLERGGVAIVGSRDIDEEGRRFAQAVGERCAEQGAQVVSGGARGVDQLAMQAAIEAGGTVVGALADSLLRAAVAGESREAIRSGRAALVSPYHPEAGFSVGAAMGRNKIIYALADCALVVASEYKEGGTWAGAAEELKRENGRPVFVRTGDSAPAGNLELLKIGARPFPPSALEGSLQEALEEAAAPKSQTPSEADASARVDLERPAPGTAAPEPEEPSERPAAAAPTEYDDVKPRLLKTLETRKSAAELAAEFGVKKALIGKWLKRAIEDGEVGKMEKPVRYIRIVKGQQGELPL
ncbi:MAG: DNA-processing protein DprA [Candidatus Sumerlaeota bacterium]|nr:DNA-processing protein DprA [Candidatus Sumerlaeota bacterium]